MSAFISSICVCIREISASFSAIIVSMSSSLPLSQADRNSAMAANRPIRTIHLTKFIANSP